LSCNSLPSPKQFSIQRAGINCLREVVHLDVLLAYIVSWGVRFRPNMSEPSRQELEGLADQVCAMRHRSDNRDEGYGLGGVWFGRGMVWEGYGLGGVWSFCFLEDLRPRPERDGF